MTSTPEKIEALEKKVAELERQLQVRRNPEWPTIAFLIASGFIRNEEECHSFLAQHKAKNDADLKKAISETVHQCLEKEFSVTVDGIQKG